MITGTVFSLNVSTWELTQFIVSREASSHCSKVSNYTNLFQIKCSVRVFTFVTKRDLKLLLTRSLIKSIALAMLTSIRLVSRFPIINFFNTIVGSIQKLSETSGALLIVIYMITIKVRALRKLCHFKHFSYIVAAWLWSKIDVSKNELQSTIEATLGY